MEDLPSSSPGERHGWDESIAGSYFGKRSFDWVWLCTVREMGLKSKTMDAFYEQKRKMNLTLAEQAQASEVPTETHKYLLKMTQAVAEELQESTGFLREHPHPSSVKAVDVCMAPGGYSSFFLERYPGSSITALSLPIKQGGHRVLIPHNTKDSRVSVTFLDVSLLGDEKARAALPFPCVPEYDHVFCDGQYLEKYTITKFEEPSPPSLWKEPVLLSLAQLLIALECVKEGGSMMVLGHQCWRKRNLEMLVHFKSFSRVRIFKSAVSWVATSSFYLLVSEIRRGEELERYKRILQARWYEIRDGPDERVRRSPEAQEAEMAKYRQMIERNGRFLLKICKPSWRIMATGLEKKLVSVERGPIAKGRMRVELTKYKERSWAEWHAEVALTRAFGEMNVESPVKT